MLEGRRKVPSRERGSGNRLYASLALRQAVLLWVERHARERSPAHWTDISQLIWINGLLLLGASVLRLSDIEDRFTCTACGKRGADVRPDFNWNRKPGAVMGYR